MVKINQNFGKLAGNYLFSTMTEKVAAHRQLNPDTEIIRMGIGDVTLPLAPAVIRAMHRAVDEMAGAETFRGYAPEQGYHFLREIIAKEEYQSRGCSVDAEEIFISDGAKCDSGNIQELFSRDNKIAVCDPVYPVYVDTNVMAGRTGAFDPRTGNYSGILYMPCTVENGFVPDLPKGIPDLIYLCFPNNPTGEAIQLKQLQEWVDYANRVGAVILYDAAYEAYITTAGVPHSIYECDGAGTCAIELRSFSKNAGFTGVRLGFAVVPKELKREGQSLHAMWHRRQGTKYNGTPYIIQRAGEAVYSAEGKSQLKGQISYYQKNAEIILQYLRCAGYTAFGGVDSPYVWLKTPKGMDSWRFFDYLLTNAGVVGTPGAGFGVSGEGYFRLTAFNTHENTIKAVKRIVGI